MLAPSSQVNPAGAPSGLVVIKDWLSPEQQQEIVDFICDASKSGSWESHLSKKRPTKHFGLRYTIKGFEAKTSNSAASTQEWGLLTKYSKQIEDAYPGIKIGQALVNLYWKDTTIGAHTDKETPVVFGLSLVGDINMIFTSEVVSLTNPHGKKLKYEAFIPRGSLYIMSGEAASIWKHEVPGRKTVSYPDDNGNLTISRPKPDWYVRLSITFRHFNGEGQMAPMIPAGVPTIIRPSEYPRSNLTSGRVGNLAVMQLKEIVPRHREEYGALQNEPGDKWVRMKSRFDKALSRLVCYDIVNVSRTAAIYGEWVILFCRDVIGLDVRLNGSFGNMYPDGHATLPAHCDKYNSWVFGLSFGETRVFDFVPMAKGNGGGKQSALMHSGDVVYFAPEVNNTHKHQILADPKRTGSRINLTFFLGIAPGQDPGLFFSTLYWHTERYPSWEKAIKSLEAKTVALPGAGPNPGGKVIINIYEDEDSGQVFAEINDVMIPFASTREAIQTIESNLNALSSL